MQALKIENLYLKVTKEYYALFNINMQINQGEHVVLLGAKGSGRTPLLRCICGLEKSFEGNIYINGQDVKSFNFADTYQVGYLPTYPVFFDAKTVRYNLEYVLKTRKVDVTLIATKVNDILSDFGLNRIADKNIYQLTEYEKFLVAVARLCLRKIDLLIIDSFEERFSKSETEFINQHLLNLQGNDTTVIKSLTEITSAYQNYKIIALKNGSIITP